MDRFAVADVLEEIALHLEFRGENPFKTRAYLNGARVLRGLDADLGELVRGGALRSVRGIGSALADKISTLVTTGGLPMLEQLREQTPPEILRWTRVPGIGPKRALEIHRALGIRTMDELEAAAREGRLRGLPGLGAATEARIVEGVATARSFAGRTLMPAAHAEAARLAASVREIAGVSRVEAAGEVRRCLEVVMRVDLVAAAEDPPRALAAFCAAGPVREPVERGEEACSVRLASGLVARLRCVAPAAFAAALLHETGSEAHLRALDGRAAARGLRRTGSAVLGSDGTPLPCPEEADAYAALGLAWIPAEIREGDGEVEAAAAGPIPRLIERGDLAGVLHVHSDWSDGRVSIEGMAEAARERGFGYLGLCDHSRSAGYAGGLSERRVAEQHLEVDRLNRRWGGGFRILKGIEVDVLPDGTLDFDDAVLATFDLVIASVHSRFALSEAEQTARVLRALANPWVDVLGHPTGRLLLSRDPYPLDLGRVMEAAVARGVAVEVNAYPNRLDLDWRELRRGLREGLLTSIDPDAHTVPELDGVRWGVAVARKAWCTPDRTLDAWALPELLEHLERRRQRAGVAR